MNSALTALVPAIGWALLHFIWQGLLIGWGAALALHLLRGARPQTRYAVACGAMLLCAALPLAAIVLQLSGDAATAGAGLAAAAAPAGSVVATAAGTVNSAAAARTGAMAGLLAALSSLPFDGNLSGWSSTLRRQLPWVVGLWLAGAVLMSLRLAIGLKWVAERTRADDYTINHYWQRRLSELARRFDIGVHVRLGVADLLDSPITAGCWRPIVLVPAALVSGMPPDLLEALLAHELAHIKRHDYLVNLIQSAIEIVLFYHPSVWALSRRIRIEREQIADDLAVGVLGRPQRLAQALSELDRFQFATTQIAHAAHGGNLMSRIKRLLRPDVEPISWKMAVPLIGLCAAGAMFYAHAAPQQMAAQSLQNVAARTAVAIAAASPDGGASSAELEARPAPEAAEAAEPPEPPAAAAPAAPAAPALRAAPAATAILAMAAVPAIPAVPAVPAIPAVPATPAVPAVPAVPAIAAVPVVPATPAMRTRSSTTTVRRVSFGSFSMLGEESSFAYALVPGNEDRMMVSGTQKDLANIDDLHHSVKGDFIWFRDGDKSYLIQDPALVAKANEAWAPANRISAQMDEQGKKMDLHGKVMEAIGKQMDAKSREASKGPEREIERQQRLIESVARQQEAIGRRIGEAARDIGDDPSPEKMRVFHEKQRQLLAEMAPLSKQMAQFQRDIAVQSAQIQAGQEPIRELGRKMAESSKPMAELGARMGELGREQAKASREAERAMKALILEAQKNGKASPAPSPA